MTTKKAKMTTKELKLISEALRSDPNYQRASIKTAFELWKLKIDLDKAKPVKAK